MKIFVVGGGSGFGCTLVRAALAAGHQVAYSTSSATDAFDGQTDLAVTGCDLTQSGQVDVLSDAIRGFAPDRLVLCMIKTHYRPMAEQTATSIDEEVTFNVAVPITLANAYAACRPDGSMTFMLSHICFLYNPGFALYKAGKDALDSFAKSLQFEYPRLKVLCVYPGAMRTGFVTNTGYAGAKVFPAAEPALWAARVLSRDSGVMMAVRDIPFLIMTRLLPFRLQKILFQIIFGLLRRK
ncbi:MAG: SDR family NAD(P)-dependent oxidoreductase [Alphaproteobacteria bacterium]|nr:SDR family NAD(P)-dependent oxidoreductase [Alphaproteobacteria bacterium]